MSCDPDVWVNPSGQVYHTAEGCARSAGVVAERTKAGRKMEILNTCREPMKFRRSVAVAHRLPLCKRCERRGRSQP